MKFLKGFGIFFLVLILAYVVMGFFGPSEYKVIRSIEIAAPVDVVFDQTTKFSNWGAWSPWAEADPEAKYTIEKDEQAVGAKMGWNGEISGEGSMVVSEIVTNQKMVYELSFIKPWEMSSVGGFNYIERDGVVSLEWYDEGNIPFTQRPMMLFMNLEEMMGPQFEDGLENIKEICEEMAAKPTIEVSEEMVESRSMLYISEKSSLMPADISAKMGAAYGELMSLLGIAKLDMSSAPVAITRKFSLEEMRCEFDAAVLIDELPENLEVSGRIEKGETYAGKTLKTVHVGSYKNLKSTYDAFIAYIASNGYEMNGDSWEEYIDDPTIVPEESRRTNIYFPVK